MEIESLFLMKYKIMITDVETKMTMIDFQSFVNNITFKTKEIEENQSKDNFNKCLIYLRDTLNYMTLGDNRIR